MPAARKSRAVPAPPSDNALDGEAAPIALTLTYTPPDGGRRPSAPAVHVLVILPTGGVSVPVGAPWPVPADQEAIYRAAPLPPGYTWGDPGAPPTVTTTTGEQEETANG
jgi:hypothetical protein